MKKALLLLCMITLMKFNVLAATYETDIINGISTGDINISITEYNTAGDLVDNEMVMPGQKVEKVIGITNNGSQSWIRAKIEFTKYLTDNDVEIASDKWIKLGNYFYYTEPVGKNEHVELMRAINIPGSLTESVTGDTFKLNTTVDAVQVANFTPDFTSGDPWFGTVIEGCLHSNPDVKVNSTSDEFSIAFEGGAEGIVRVGDNFFNNWSDLMPGDTLRDKVILKNNYSRSVSIYFRTEVLDDNDLSKAINLKIYNDSTLIYNGALNRSLDEILLGKLNKGDTLELNYEVSLPAELTNKYALSNAKTKWYFRCVVNGSGSNSSGGGTGGSIIDWFKRDNTSSIELERSPETSSIQKSVDVDLSGDNKKHIKTGDESQLELYIASTLFFGLLAIILILVDKKRKKDEDK